MLAKNDAIRRQIADLEKQREGMSYGSVDYPRITADINSLALQLKAEHHWSAAPGFWVAVVAMVAACVAAYSVLFPTQPSPTGVPQSTNGSSKTKAASSLTTPLTKK